MTPIKIISRSMKYGLHLAVTWPGTPLPVLRKFCWIIILIVFQAGQYSYVITHYKSDTLIEMVDNLSITMAFTLVLIKLCIAWKHSTQLSEILSIMEEESQKYAALDKNNFISKAMHISYHLSSFVIYTYMLAAGFYMLGAFVPQDTNTTFPELLLKMDFPFDTSESPINELVISMQFFYQTTAAYIFGVFTALLLMAVLHVGSQIDVMCHTLLEVPYRSNSQLKFFISRHQEIITFAGKIEKLFTYMALSQLVSNTLMICTLGYILVIAIQVENGITMILKCIMFYISICLEAFVYCFAGEYLSIKSKLISDTAYEFLWYHLHPNESQYLILVILRAQKGFTFTFGKFASLSMESFAVIMKASVSYISVLLAMT
ncbi:odorant receptor 82a-like [Xylocopa sonorina]|uniref:odorant receptor 82a-like n=1 Tax=Xylocopa sonorina TaxID=1818115 RepID=UPI00403B330B